MPPSIYHNVILLRPLSAATRNGVFPFASLWKISAPLILRAIASNISRFPSCAAKCSEDPCVSSMIDLFARSRLTFAAFWLLLCSIARMRRA
ncbi:hypothetical protein BDZ85DRAFT_262774 [Elsinoe ampelina]|uniref:Uncharacterized protein n=1 Tax=Elsinoe ampelina TaxID=302913 RepID=A0A6A6GBR4_9PEZI|nr:hypothetical protein BDZ85DRAFT_262774 [Elsinoe ampelina]